MGIAYYVFTYQPKLLESKTNSANILAPKFYFILLHLLYNIYAANIFISLHLHYRVNIIIIIIIIVFSFYFLIHFISYSINNFPLCKYSLHRILAVCKCFKIKFYILLWSAWDLFCGLFLNCCCKKKKIVCKIKFIRNQIGPLLSFWANFFFQRANSIFFLN